MINSICVYCGSSNGVNKEYIEQAEALGKLFARENIRLVYGGGSLGVMNALARSVSSNGGKVLGIIPHALNQISGGTPGEEILVDTMHERKAKMIEMADAFICLPGGFGTMEELLETITWSQLRIHTKPVGILNIGGYFDHLIKFLDFATEQGFIDEKSRRILVVEDTPESLLHTIREYKDPISGEWIIQGDMWKTRAKGLHPSDI